MDAKITNTAAGSALAVPLTGGGSADVQPGQTRYLEGVDDTDATFVSLVSRGLLLVEKQGVTFTIGAEAADVILVGVQVHDESMRASTPSTPFAPIVYLSDAATGIGITATAAGTLQSTSGDTVELVAGKVLLAMTTATGEIELEITQAAGQTYYVVVVLGGRLYVSDAVTFAA